MLQCVPFYVSRTILFNEFIIKCVLNIILLKGETLYFFIEFD